MRGKLIKAARKAAEDAYCPYSGFPVGAAVLAGNKIYTGCNIENASYGLTICAERVAIFKAISDGQISIDAIAVTCLKINNYKHPIEQKISCGACRQVMIEFMKPCNNIYIDGEKTYKLQDLIPVPFSLHQEIDPENFANYHGCGIGL